MIDAAAALETIKDIGDDELEKAVEKLFFLAKNKNKNLLVCVSGERNRVSEGLIMVGCTNEFGDEFRDNLKAQNLVGTIQRAPGNEIKKVMTSGFSLACYLAADGTSEGATLAKR